MENKENKNIQEKRKEFDNNKKLDKIINQLDEIKYKGKKIYILLSMVAILYLIDFLIKVLCAYWV